MGWAKNRNYPGSDPTVGESAAGHYGLVTRDQLLKAAISPDIIDYRLASGRLIRAYSGVYWLGYVRPEPTARAAAAVLGGGPHAVLSHTSAEALWGMSDRWPTAPEITLTRGDRRPAGVRVHRSRVVTGSDIRRHKGIRTTSPARTLLDVARRLTDRERTRAFQSARLAGYLHQHALAATLDRNPRHPGARLIRPLLETFASNPTRSPLEDDFLPWARRHGLPDPEVNVMVAGHLVDVLFGEQRLIVELDGWEFHRDRVCFENDRERDAATSALGFLTYRLTRRRFDTQSDLEAYRLNSIIDQRRTTTPAEAHVASASGRSSGATPARSG